MERGDVAFVYRCMTPRTYSASSSSAFGEIAARQTSVSLQSRTGPSLAVTSRHIRFLISTRNVSMPAATKRGAARQRRFESDQTLKETIPLCNTAPSFQSRVHEFTSLPPEPSESIRRPQAMTSRSAKECVVLSATDDGRTYRTDRRASSLRSPQ